MNIQSAPPRPDTVVYGPAGRPAMPSADIFGSAREILRVLNRRKLLIAATLIGVMAATFLILSSITPRYTATALVMLDSRKTKVVNSEAVLSGLPNDIASIQSEVEILRSRTMARKVADKLNIIARPEFNPAVQPWYREYLEKVGIVGPAPVLDPQTARERVVDAVMSRTTVTPRGRSYAMGISFESSDRRFAAEVANAIADFYIVDQLETKFEATKRATDWLNEKLTDLRKQVEVAERAVAAYRERNRLNETSRESNVTTQQVVEINTQLTLAKAQTAEREARLRQVNELLRSPRGAESAAEVLSSPLIQRLREQETEVVRREAELSNRYGPNHPRMLNVRSEMVDLKKKIEDEVRKIVQGLTNEVQVAKARESTLQTQLDRLERQAGDLGRSAVGLRQLEREAESSRVIYNSFMGRFKETREQEDIQQADARIISGAVPPNASSYPQRSLILAIALLGAVALAAGLVVLVERLDSGFRSSDQLENETGLPVLGTVPLIPSVASLRKSPVNYIVEKPTSAYAEALRGVFTAISLGTLDHPPKIIMVTSSVPGEGKSTFSVSLARLMAKTGRSKKVCIVDLDLRRPSVQKLIGKKDTNTIEQYILGEKQLDEIIHVDEKSGLHFVTARSKTPNPVELLESEHMREFLLALSRVYDLVILDTPPALAVADPRIVASIADYIVFLVQWERTPRELALKTVKLLSETGRRVGAVLNQVNPRRQAKYGYGDYGSYARYNRYYTN